MPAVAAVENTLAVEDVPTVETECTTCGTPQDADGHCENHCPDCACCREDCGAWQCERSRCRNGTNDDGTGRGPWHCGNGYRCDRCDRCEEHCECMSCDRRGDRVDSDDYYCSECNRCHDCCECMSCDRCGDRVDSDDYCSECNRCHDCCECNAKLRRREGTGQFHDGKPHPIGPVRYVSAEIEAENSTQNADDAAIDRWGAAVKADASLYSSGVEVCSAPSRGDAWVRQIKDLCAVVEHTGGEATKACGLHIHVDARDLDDAALRRLMILWLRVEGAAIELADRDPHPWARPCGEPFAEILARSAPVREQVSDGGSLYGRYWALNLKALNQHGTVEIRLHKGWTGARRIIAWGALMSGVVETARRCTRAECAAWPTTVEGLLRCAPDAVAAEVRAIWLLPEPAVNPAFIAAVALAAAVTVAAANAVETEPRGERRVVTRTRRSRRVA